MPISFNPKSNQFHMTKNTSTNKAQYFSWLLIVFFLFLGCSVGSGGYVVVRQFIKPKVHITMAHIILYSIMCGAVSLVVGIVIYVLKYGEEVVKTVNWLIQFHDYLVHGNDDVTEIIMFAMVLPLPYIPTIATTFGMIANLDVYKFVLENVMPTAVVRTIPVIAYMWVLQIQLMTRIVGKMSVIDLNSGTGPDGTMLKDRTWMSRGKACRERALCRSFYIRSVRSIKQRSMWKLNK
ncbi:hypothetical protein Fcan01_28334 [Folsomia candida]|uniref:Uncharacterized protein n=1 Tax=Folsomia candida TaxID=158441 RepID=A0A226CWB1_FOLCA|nr:hypothetical protein Fcan01_28334 [Folsomia candida]